jgi:hypothetical protein
MERRCVFLEDLGGDKLQRCIYQSPFRRLPNCACFPLNQPGIDRHACSRGTASALIPIQPDRSASPCSSAGPDGSGGKQGGHGQPVV